ncbi:MAG: hypothetical protein ACR2J8_10760 [Thermomicrobiales bacterium]
MRQSNRFPRALAALAVLIMCLTGTLALPPAAAGAQDAPDGPTQVTVGVYINDIHNLDLHAYNYTVDFYIWMRWKNPELNPFDTLEFMNADQPWDSDMTLFYDEPLEMPDGSLYQAARYIGLFSSKFPLQTYPFDHQQLMVQFEDNTWNEDYLVYVPDTEPVTINAATSLPGYRINPPSFNIGLKDYPTTFGDLTVTEPTPYSRGVVTVEVDRPGMTSIIKVILPILLVVLVAALVFLINPVYPEARVGMGITALLTLVALQFTTSTELPQVDYLMMLDLLYIVSFAYVLLVMIASVATSWMATDDHVETTRALDRKVLLWSGIAYATAVVGVIFFFIRG